MIHSILISALIVAIAFLPFCIIALLLGIGRPFMLRALIVHTSTSALLVIIILGQSGRTAADFSKAIGPSWHSLIHVLMPILGLTVVFPIIGLGLLRFAGEKLLNWRNRRLWISNWMLRGMVVVALWVIFLCFFGGFTHEDTEWAKGFSHDKWEQIQSGMARRDVEALVGSPLKKSVQGFANDKVLPDMWTYNHSAGYFAAIWFTNDIVSHKAFWFAD